MAGIFGRFSSGNTPLVVCWPLTICVSSLVASATRWQAKKKERPQRALLRPLGAWPSSAILPCRWFGRLDLWGDHVERRGDMLVHQAGGEFCIARPDGV